MKYDKVVLMECPSCKKTYPPTDVRPTLNLETGKIENVEVSCIRCRDCDRGLVRRVHKESKKKKRAT